MPLTIVRGNAVALPADLIWEIRTTGDNTFGGAFSAAYIGTGTDYSQQATAQVVFDGATITGSTTGTSATFVVSGHTVSNADKGNVLNITGGSGFTTGRYVVNNVNTGTNEWTLDRTCCAGASSGLTGNMGGCLAALTTAAGTTGIVSGNTIWVKAGTYTSGSIAINDTSRWLGYNATRGDWGTRPVLAPSGTGVELFRVTAGAVYLDNIDLTNSGAHATCTALKWESTASAQVRRCKVSSFTSYGFRHSGTGQSVLYDIEVTGQSGPSFETSSGGIHAIYACTAKSGGVGFNLGSAGIISRCYAINNTGGSTDGFSLGNGIVVNCVSHGNGRRGFNIGSTVGHLMLVNCIATSNTGNDFLSAATTNMFQHLIKCFSWNNGGSNSGFDATQVDVTALTGDPYTNAAGNDFSLNNTAGAGASVRDAGFPGVFPGLSTTGYLDGGPAQHQGVTVAPAALIIRRSTNAAGEPRPWYVW